MRISLPHACADGCAKACAVWLVQVVVRDNKTIMRTIIRVNKMIIMMIITIEIVIVLTIVRIIIVTLPRLPPTHLEYSFVDSLAFRVRGSDFRRLAVTNVSRIVVVGGSICHILRVWGALGVGGSMLAAWGGWK